MINEEELRGRHDEEKQELRRQLDKKDEILEGYKREKGQLEVFFKRVINHIEPITPFPSVFEKTKQKPVSESEVVPGAHITDSHMGAVQEPDEIEEFNEFNPEICENRNIGFAHATIRWAHLHRNIYKINQLHVLMTGDLISGDIHDELKITNAFPTPVQVHRAAQVHTKQIALFAPHFERVIVHFLTEDNHSRLTKKPQAKEAGKNSMNYLVGLLMEAYLEKHNNVEFNIYPQHAKVVSIADFNYLLMHGHGIKAWMGIPWYGIERRIARESTARQHIIMRDIEQAKEIGFNKVIHGHFHTPFDSVKFACGGSVSGTDAFDHQHGRHSDPSQSVWMIHPKHGEFNRTNFNLKQFDDGEA